MVDRNENTPMQSDNPESVAEAQEDLAESPATDPQELTTDEADPIAQTVADEGSQE